MLCKDIAKEFTKVSGQFADLGRPFHTALTRDTEEMLKALLYMLKIKAKASKRAQTGSLGKIKVILTVVLHDGEKKKSTCFMLLPLISCTIISV